MSTYILYLDCMIRLGSQPMILPRRRLIFLFSGRLAKASNLRRSLTSLITFKLSLVLCFCWEIWLFPMIWGKAMVCSSRSPDLLPLSARLTWSLLISCSSYVFNAIRTNYLIFRFSLSCLGYSGDMTCC